MQKVTDNIFLLVLFAMTGTFILAAAFIFFFLKYQRRVALQKEAMQKAEVAYSEQLLNATLISQEDERKRIGRDLHDDVGASLSNLKMIMAQTVTVAEGKPEYKPLIDKIITTVRTISHSLSPPGLELFGLEYTLHELFDGFAAGGVIAIDFQNNLGKELDTLNDQTALAIFRVMQELLSNTVKHAGAKNISIKTFAADNASVITYHDDGKGMDNGADKKNGMGMQNIMARLKMIQASGEITTAEGKGFLIKITIPQQAIVTV
ncbi:sensor histidine kinase [Ferruginibacter sp. SUN106]|uniref:sensor histidine kinase n=1 Tax=Ferruginibacter sp. SUN106 TaxID=2978348 RepID=UPI003D368D57